MSGIDPPGKRTAARRKALEVVMGDDGSLHVGRGGHIRVDAANVAFAAAVVDDLCRIARAPAGAALIACFDPLAQRIVIEKPAIPIDPPNGTVAAEDLRAATAAGRLLPAVGEVPAPLGTGAGTGSRIRYDPAEWPWPGEPSSPTGAQVLRALLRQARTNALGEDDPTDGLPCDASAE